jgi:hypothetical protein
MVVYRGLGFMLDYQARKVRYQLTAEDREWRRKRMGWYGLQILLFLVIVYRIGPNLILFHSPFSPAPKDFVPFTSQYVQMIAAIKAYNRDFGQLPLTSMDLPPQYMPPGYNGDIGEIGMTTSITFPIADHGVLEYEFSPAMEGWIVHSPRYDGRIPAPIVTAAPKPAATQPAARPHAGPVTGPSTNVSHGK